MIELTPLAVSHKDVLRWLAANTPQPASAVAAGTDRDASNVRRDLRKLVEAGLVSDDEGLFGIADNGRAMVAALDRAEANAVRAGGADDAPEGFIWLTHADIRPDPKNARKVFDPEGLGELADSIGEKGLLQKPAVRLIEGEDGAQLVDGERRWRAWNLLIERGMWAADHRELCPLVSGDDAHADEAGLIANLQRRDLTPLEEARGFQRLIEDHGHTSATIAERTGFSQRNVQHRMQLLKLKPADMAKLEKGDLTLEKARSVVANYPTLRELSPAAWLAALEVFAASLRRQASPDKTDEVLAQPTCTEDPVWPLIHSEVWSQELVSRLSEEHRDGELTGRHYVRPGWKAREQLELKFGPLDTMGKIHRALWIARRENGLSESGCDWMSSAERENDAVTSWLQGPFEEAPDLAKRLADRQAAATRRREEAEQQANRRQFKAKLGAAETAQILATQPGVRTDQQDLFAQAMDNLGQPLPWRVQGQHVYAADGSHLYHLEWYGATTEADRCADLLQVWAMNSAGGFGWAQAEDANETALDRDAFVSAMAGRLAEVSERLPEECEVRAGEILDEFLTDNTVAYGDDGYRWDDDGAREIIDAHLEADGADETVEEA